MSDLEIAQINLLKTQQTRPTRPDLEPVRGTSYSSLASDLVETYVENVRKRSRRLVALPEDDLLKATGVLSVTGEATLAGLYALGAHPQGQRPALGVTAAVQMPTGSPTRNRDLAHFNGPMPDLLDEAMLWIARNTPSDMGYDERGRGRDFSALPMRAVRELVANALVHRNLDAITDNKRIEIRIKDDKLIISSPGGLRGLSLEQLGKPNGKNAVNPALYEICKDIRGADGVRLIEGEGGGIQEVRAAAEEYGLPEPIFRDYGVSFVAILYWRISPDILLEQPAPSPRRIPAPTRSKDSSVPIDIVDVSKNAPRVWAALSEPQSFSSLVVRSGLSSNATRWALNRLIATGNVEMLGTQGDRGTTYRRICADALSESESQ
ncbi:AAA family ATPase [Actinomyces sp. B33]|uniref:ATP-binding protein n=1 Tax=Actinomyces sp. B33 TaxID=2942131 RepID=UPI002341782F|nr:ATP-binding protein [Actinomyces sp. B33]MDC4232533.1 AAA family ATPase [Actinomyces sp. B33]